MSAKILSSSYLINGDFKKAKTSISLENNDVTEKHQQEELSKEIDSDISSIENSDSGSLESFIFKGQKTIAKVKSFLSKRGINLSLKDSYIDYGVEFLEGHYSFLMKSKTTTLDSLKTLKETLKLY